MNLSFFFFQEFKHELLSLHIQCNFRSKNCSKVKVIVNFIYIYIMELALHDVNKTVT